MRNPQEALRIIHTAYEIDANKLEDKLDVKAALAEIGVMTFHITYYDGGLVQDPDIRALLKQYPNGQLATLVRGLRDARLGEYSKDRLDKMYGLSGL